MAIFYGNFSERVRDEVGRNKYVDVVRQSFPSPLHTFDLGLSTKLPFSTNFERDSGDLAGEDTELRHHVVDGGLQVEHLALDINVDLLGQVA
jgi:hypothetical protein